MYFEIFESFVTISVAKDRQNHCNFFMQNNLQGFLTFLIGNN